MSAVVPIAASAAGGVTTVNQTSSGQPANLNTKQTRRAARVGRKATKAVTKNVRQDTRGKRIANKAAQVDLKVARKTAKAKIKAMRGK